MSQSILGFISLFISIGAFIFSCLSYKDSKSANVKEYFAQGDSDEQKRYRKVIYDIYNDYKDSDPQTLLEKLMSRKADHAISHVVSFYDFWALMNKKHYLPFWTFYGPPGKRAYDIYQMLLPYIHYRLSHNDPQYVVNYEWLIKKIMRKGCSKNLIHYSRPVSKIAEQRLAEYDYLHVGEADTIL